METAKGNCNWEQCKEEGASRERNSGNLEFVGRMDHRHCED